MFRTKIATTWAATQVGPRPVESGLGGHEEGVFRVDEGVKKTSLPLRKRGRVGLSECVTISGFTRVENDPDSEKRNRTKDTTQQEMLSEVYDSLQILSAS